MIHYFKLPLKGSWSHAARPDTNRASPSLSSLAPSWKFVIALKHGEKVIGPHQRWLDALGVHSVGDLNRTCIEGSVGQLIAVSEGHHEKRVSRIADAIVARRDRVKVICIAGPSSSGGR